MALIACLGPALASPAYSAPASGTSAPPARAEGVLERVARSGELRMIGPADHPPMLSLDAQGRPQGYVMVVATRIAELVSAAVGRPVRVQFEAVTDAEPLTRRLGEGQAELACALPFSWARDQMVDFSMPIGLSGLRLMAPAGRFTGAPALLAGRRIAVVRDSLAETQLRGLQPAARLQAYGDLPAALTALTAGQVEGVVGDSALLAGLAHQRGLKGMALTPEAPYLRYALACAVPENNSAFQHLVNRAITQLLQDYIAGDATSVTAINRWVGPGSALNLPAEQIRGVFDALLIGVEPLRPAPAPAGASR